MKYHWHESYGWLCSGARIYCHINLCVLQNSYLFHDGEGYSQFTKANVKNLLSNTNTGQKLRRKVCHVSVPVRSPDPAEQEVTCAMLYYVTWEWNHCCQSPTVSISKTVKGQSHSATDAAEIQKRTKQSSSCHSLDRIQDPSGSSLGLCAYGLQETLHLILNRFFLVTLMMLIVFDNFLCIW